MFNKLIKRGIVVILLVSLAVPLVLVSAAPAAPDVYNGKKIDQSRVEWQVLIYYGMRGPRGGLLCGGTVISTYWILTAAHCFRTKGGEPIPDGLLAFSQGSTALTAGRRQIEIKKIVEHPSYVFGVWDNDIALVQTNTPMTVTSISLAGALQAPTGRLQVVGWGETETALVSVDLLYTDIPIVPNSECEKLPEYKGRLTERLMCAGRSGADSCHGDSGGPLYTPLTAGAGLQHGVTVAGEGCGKLPGIYTRVASYRPWIEQVLAPTYAKLRVATGTETALHCDASTHSRIC